MISKYKEKEGTTIKQNKTKQKHEAKWHASHVNFCGKKVKKNYVHFFLYMQILERYTETTGDWE